MPFLENQITKTENQIVHLDNRPLFLESELTTLDIQTAYLENKNTTFLLKTYKQCFGFKMPQKSK